MSESLSPETTTERLVVLAAKAVATRIIVGVVVAIVTLVGAYFFLIDRTLSPLTNRVEALDSATNSELLQIQSTLQENARLLGSLNANISFIRESAERSEIAMAAILQEQRTISDRIGRIEARIPQDQNFEYIPPVNPFKNLYRHVNLTKWEVEPVLNENGILKLGVKPKNYLPISTTYLLCDHNSEIGNFGISIPFFKIFTETSRSAVAEEISTYLSKLNGLFDDLFKNIKSINGASRELDCSILNKNNREVLRFRFNIYAYAGKENIKLRFNLID